MGNSISYVEDKNMLAMSNVNRNYNEIERYIEVNKEEFDYYIEQDKQLYGYKVNLIRQLTDIYGFDVYAIEFYFKNIKNYFNQDDDQQIGKLIKKLKKQINKYSGYYILKVPSSNPMLINQININKLNQLFAGNTISYYIDTFELKKNKKSNINILKATTNDKNSYFNDIINLSEKSFENHFTQYHISYITREKAPLIYRDWISEYLLDNKEKSLLIAELEEKVVGFLAYIESIDTIEIILNSVDENYRGQGIYNQLLNEVSMIANERDKVLTVSTQLDNYYPQRAWISLGFKPYHSFYLFHYNNLNGDNY